MSESTQESSIIDIIFDNIQQAGKNSQEAVLSTVEAAAPAEAPPAAVQNENINILKSILFSHKIKSLHSQNQSRQTTARVVQAAQAEVLSTVPQQEAAPAPPPPAAAPPPAGAQAQAPVAAKTAQAEVLSTVPQLDVQEAQAAPALPAAPQPAAKSVQNENINILKSKLFTDKLKSLNSQKQSRQTTATKATTATTATKAQAAPPPPVVSSTPPPAATTATKARAPAVSVQNENINILKSKLFTYKLKSLNSQKQSRQSTPAVRATTNKRYIKKKLDELTDSDKLFFKKYGLFGIEYEIYYKGGDENEGVIISDIDKNKSFNYFIYKQDNSKIIINPIKKYYTLTDILKYIYKLYKKIIIVSKGRDIQNSGHLYQYKDYNKINLIFIYDNIININNINNMLFDTNKNNRYSGNITIEEYNNINTEIYS